MNLLKVKTEVDQKVIDLLSQNTIGIPGGMLYRHCGVKDKITFLKEPVVVSLERKSKLIGACLFCIRKTAHGHIPLVYIRYFSFLESFRSPNRPGKAGRTNTMIKKEIETLFETGIIPEKFERPIFCAYVDYNNLRSRLVCDRFDFQQIRSFSALVFSRMFPQRNDKIQQAPDKERIKSLLSDFYSGYSLFFLENFNAGKYYFIKDEMGYIVAGAQASAEHWEILNLPGFSGKLITLFQRIPFLRRLFSKNYHFLSLDYVICREGCEKELSALFEGLLQKFNLFSAVVCMDNNSGLYQSVRRKINWGIINKLKKEMCSHVVVRLPKGNSQEIQELREKPVFVSSFDVT